MMFFKVLIINAVLIAVCHGIIAFAYSVHPWEKDEYNLTGEWY